MTTTITVKGQVTLPKSVREATGLRPGDQVEVRALGGSVIVERAPAPDRKREAEARVECAMADLRRRRIKPTSTTDELMRLLRGND
jgi:AbrB family looped-hinge helix DNA binding protein